MHLTLYIATTNPGKLRDFDAVARSYDGVVDVLPLPGLHAIPPPLEDGATFEENACIKAMEYSRNAPGMLVLADDSGLAVDALDVWSQG